MDSAGRYPFRASPTHIPQPRASPHALGQVSPIHSHPTSLADPALEFGSKSHLDSSLFPGQQFAGPWTLIFLYTHLQVGAHLTFLCLSAPQTKLEPQALPLTQEGRLSLAEISHEWDLACLVHDHIPHMLNGVCWLTVGTC